MCRKGEEEDGEWGMMGHRHPGKKSLESLSCLASNEVSSAAKRT